MVESSSSSSSISPCSSNQLKNNNNNNNNNHRNRNNFVANTLSAAGAAFLSAILVNPLDVAKTRLQAQAAGAPYAHPLSNALSRMAFFGPTMMFADLRCSPTCARAGIQGTVSICPPDCFHYKGTLDALYKIVRQTYAGRSHTTMERNKCWPRIGNTNVRNFRFLWTGLGVQLARDVPYSAMCWSILEPMRWKLMTQVGDGACVLTVLGSNFSAGFIAGSLAAGATCPLDVARTRRQIEKDPLRALKMTTRQTLVEIWRDGGMRGLFAGAGPRVARAGPSVGIVVSFYEVVKYMLQTRFSSCS